MAALNNIGGFQSNSGLTLSTIVSPSPNMLHFNYADISNLECSKFISKMINRSGNISAIVNGVQEPGGTSVANIVQNCSNNQNSVTIVLTNNISVAGLIPLIPSGPAPAPSPSPSPSPVPSPAPSPSPVPTPAPSPSPVPSPAPSPSPVPTPSPSPVPTPSPAPSPVPAPVPTPSPVPAPAPSVSVSLGGNTSRDVYLYISIPPSYAGQAWKVIYTASDARGEGGTGSISGSGVFGSVGTNDVVTLATYGGIIPANGLVSTPYTYTGALTEPGGYYGFWQAIEYEVLINGVRFHYGGHYVE